MSPINLEDQYVAWVEENIVQMFSDKGIEVTTNARQLLAFAMQSQIDESLMDQETLLERVNQVSGENLLEYYEERYGEKALNFNHAFHLLADWGFVVKFPFGPTTPSAAASGFLGEDTTEKSGF
jgi:hypothetical protein